MLFNSFVFIFLFLPVVVVGFILLRQIRREVPWLIWLTGASLFFYAWWNPAYLILLIGSILINYMISAGLRNSKFGRRSQKALLGIGIAANVSVLLYYKYAAFFVASVSVTNAERFQLEDIVLPLGISFFTLQQIAYLIDTFRGGSPRYNILRYAFFVSFFPQLIAGPIVHHAEFMPQIGRVVYRKIGYDFSVGITVFSIGLAKKVIIADRLSTYASPVFDATAAGVEVTFLEAWLAAAAYGLQLFFDFSGYSDMAVGLGRMFGLRLPINFLQPYNATSLIDFWRQWHITLSRFLRHYIYIPLGGNRHSSQRQYAAILATMTIGGIWHGAGWTFVVWGAAHGLALSLNHGWRKLRRGEGRSEASMMATWGSRVLTFGVVTLLWVPFRSNSLTSAGSMLESMAGGNGMALPGRLESIIPSIFRSHISFDGSLQLTPRQAGEGTILVLALLLVVWFLPSTHEIMAKGRIGSVVRSGRNWWVWRPNLQWAVITAVLVSASMYLMLTNVSEFLYFQF